WRRRPRPLASIPPPSTASASSWGSEMAPRWWPGSGRVLQIRDRLLISYGSVLVIAAAGLILGLISVLGLAEYNARSAAAHMAAVEAVAEIRGSLQWQQGLLLDRREPLDGGQQARLRERD